MRIYIYDHEIADEIIDRVSEGETLNRVCMFDERGDARVVGEFPRPITVYNWCNPTSNTYHPEFCVRFAEARLAQQWVWVEQTIDISDEKDEAEETTTEEVSGTGAQGSFDKSVTRTVRKDATTHRAMRIATRFKAVAMMNPKLWTDKGAKAKEDDDREITVHGGLFD